MKILRSWLDDFLETVERTNQQITEDLESLGHEVEEVLDLRINGLVVGAVVRVDQHPNADRLNVAQVLIDDRELTIVCGAPNLAEGQKVPVALVGTKLPGGTIEERSIRGVLSSGMICAEDELGLSSNHDGIMVLDPSLKAGEPFQPEADAIFDIAVTSNRGDVLSYVGMSRDLGARWKQPLKRPAAEVDIASTVVPKIEINSPEAAPRYSARFIRNINSNALSETLLKRLQMTGHGQYHPVVDITNYVLEELGIPLHAFDAAKVEFPIQVRFAQKGEVITLLNNKTYSLEESDLVIADQAGPVALAGIMGAKNSAVDPNTTDVLLEAAYFQPSTIRRTKYRLGILSDAAYRFERGVDPNLIETASDRASSLMSKQLNGQVGPIEIVGERLPDKSVPFKPDLINGLLGSDLSHKQIESILTSLGFVVAGQLVHVPSWRHDISINEDLAEEVARVYGYDNLPRQKISSDFSQPRPEDDLRYHQIEWLKDQLALAGFSEHIGSSFISDTETKEIEKLGDPEVHQELIKLKNPVSEEASYLRPNLTLSLVKALAKNPIFPEVQLFEIGTVFGNQEAVALGLIWTGQADGVDEKLKKVLPISAEVQPLAKGLKDLFKIRRPAYIYAGQIDFELLAQKAGENNEQARSEKVTIFRPFSKYQPVMRDIALLVERKLQPEMIVQTIRQVPLVVDVELFDQFSSEKLGDQQSLAFHILLEHPDRTLTGEEIQETMDAVSGAVQKKFHATIR